MTIESRSKKRMGTRSKSRSEVARSKHWKARLVLASCGALRVVPGSGQVKKFYSCVTVLLISRKPFCHADGEPNLHNLIKYPGRSSVCTIKLFYKYQKLKFK